jgi:TM2 domain-containing membrane protein YozV
MNMRGHVDVKFSMLMFAIILAIGADQLYRQRTGESLISLVPFWVWVALAVAALMFIAWFLHRKRPRVEVTDGRAVIHFDGRSLEVQPGTLEVRRWSTGGAFGQPYRRCMSISRGAEVIYEGAESDAERLLAAYEGLQRAHQ